MMRISRLLSVLFSCGVATAKEGGCSSGECGLPAAEDSTSLMQVFHSTANRRAGVSAHADSSVGGSCSLLANQGAFFTVPVHVGTPEQHFNLVADTGSDALIIPDCRCVNAGYCDKLDRQTCFTAANSSSFGLDVKKKVGNSVSVMGAKMNYGSGQIQVLVSSEHVRVAGVKAPMHNGVFLMEDRRSLNVHGDFEGILGLGLPHAHKLAKGGVKIPSFLEASSASKYTLCFNEYPNPGALRLGMDALPNPMTNIGTVHWGLDLHGFSTGDHSSPAVFCSPDSKTQSQKTACAAIPDSGTTLLMGPQAHIRQLYGSLCDKWPRCKQAADKDKAPKDKAFHDLLADCETWMTDAQGVNEVPSVFIHLAGSEGKSQHLELSAWAYVVETNQEIYKVVTTKIFGATPIAAAVDTGKKKKICTASFGPQEYNTAQNGPVWIMGAPIFYATTVGYDIGGKDGSKPQMSILEGSCKLCNDTETTSLLASGSVTEGAQDPHPVQRRLRHISNIREPRIDMSRRDTI